MILAKDVALKVNGTLHGDGNAELEAIKPIANATARDLSFFSPSSKRNEKDLFTLACNSKAGAILVKEYLPEVSTTQIVVPNPMAAVIGLALVFHPRPKVTPGIHPTAVVDKTAKVGENVSVGAFCAIGENVIIGNNTVIHPHVVVYPGAKIGAECIIHSFASIRECVIVGNDCLILSGAVIGSEGFGYIPEGDEGHRRIPHVGSVILEDGVDVGANSTIDRGTLGETKIGKNTKVDNLVQIGHNVQVGQASLLCSQVGVSGSTTIGRNVILAGQVGLADHLKIGDRVRILAKSGVGSDIPDGTDIAGIPNENASIWRRQVVFIKKLPELFSRLRRIEEKLGITESK